MMPKRKNKVIYLIAGLVIWFITIEHRNEIRLMMSVHNLEVKISRDGNKSPLSFKLVAEKQKSDSYPQCTEEVRKIAFAKTHKAGSSTMQSIFFRFGINRGLLFALPEYPSITIFDYLNPGRRNEPRAVPWSFEELEPFQYSKVQKFGHPDLTFNIFTAHAMWNYDEVERTVPNSYKLSILREPLSQFISFWAFYNMSAEYNIRDFALNLKRYGPNWFKIPNPEKRIMRNPQFQDLGLKDGQLPEERLKELDHEMDQVLIMETMEEGLVLMAENLCWDLEDVTFIPKLERKTKLNERVLSDDTVEYLKEWLKDDYLLYNHYLDIHRQRVAQFGEEEMNKRVELLKNRNIDIAKRCKKRHGDWTGEWRGEWCKSYTRMEIQYTELIRNKTMELLAEGLKNRIDYQNSKERELLKLV